MSVSSRSTVHVEHVAHANFNVISGSFSRYSSSRTNYTLHRSGFKVQTVALSLLCVMFLP